MDWAKYAPYFKPEEFACRHCGKVEMKEEFMDTLLRIRKRYDRPIVITSGYRCYDHPIEANKLTKSGSHPSGLAADIAAYGDNAVDLIEIALAEGIRGIGPQQKGEIQTRFVHLDVMPRMGTRRVIWTYE